LCAVWFFDFAILSLSPMQIILNNYSQSKHLFKQICKLSINWFTTLNNPVAVNLLIPLVIKSYKVFQIIDSIALSLLSI